MPHGYVFEMLATTYKKIYATPLDAYERHSGLRYDFGLNLDPQGYGSEIFAADVVYKQ